MNPYISKNKNYMIEGDGVKFLPLNNLKDWIGFTLREKQKKIPLGGSVQCLNLYEGLFENDAFSQLFRGECILSIPAGSGNTIQELYRCIIKKSDTLKLFCPVTATAPKLYNYMKYSGNQAGIKYFIPSKLTWSQYVNKAKWFFDYSGIALDPIHTIYLLDVLEKHKKFRGNLILWISCPKNSLDY